MLLLLQFLSSDNLSHLPASLLKPDDALMKLLDLLILDLIPDLFLSDLPVKLIDLTFKLGDKCLSLLDLTGYIQDTLVLLLHL